MENTTLNPSLYRLLCVDQRATKKQLKESYIGLLKIYHPDKNPDKIEWATEQTQMLNLAHEILSDDEKRANYDDLLNDFLANDKKKTEEEKKKKNWQAKATHNAPKQTKMHSTDAGSFAPVLFGLAALALLAFADRKSTRLNSSHIQKSRMPSSA